MISSQWAAEILSGEPDLEERINAAKQRATKIVSGEVENTEDLFARLAVSLSKYYKMPFHSEFFANLTLDEMLLEVFLLTEQEKTPESAIAEAIKDNQDELNDLFKDFGELGEPMLSQEEEDFVNNQGADFMSQGFGAFAKGSDKD